MKAIVLHQPWAQFIALGWKTLETRSWATNYRGPLAICAAKTTAHIDGAYSLAGRAGFDSNKLPPGLDWPLGVVVAVASLTACTPSESPIGAWAPWEAVLGDLSPGRFAWALENVRALPNPVHLRGRQGLWTLDGRIAKAVLAQVEAAPVVAGGSHV